jgi:uncharacterized protein DUF3553
MLILQSGVCQNGSGGLFMQNVQKGNRVKHITQEVWGIGQVLDMVGEYASVFFTEVGEKKLKPDFLVPLEGSAGDSGVLDNLRKRPSKKMTRYRTVAELRQWFLSAFPEGFYGAKYLEQERDYKVAACEFLKSVLDESTYSALLAESNFEEICKRALQVLNKTNLVFPNEKMALKDGLKEAKGQELFARSLFGLLFGNSEPQPRFESFTACLEEIGAAKWTVATYFQFLNNPNEQMFVKPSVTQAAADICAFELNYRPELNWTTYESVLKFSHHLFSTLSDLKPRDFIDIQSFIWCAERIADGDEKKEEPPKRRARGESRKRKASKTPGMHEENQEDSESSPE